MLASAAQHGVVTRQFVAQTHEAEAALERVTKVRIFSSALRTTSSGPRSGQGSSSTFQGIKRIVFVKGNEVVFSAGDRAAIAPAGGA